MTPKERSKQLARIIHDHYCKDNLRLLTETGIERAIVETEKEAAKEKHEACMKIMIELSEKLSALHGYCMRERKYERAGHVGSFILEVGDVIERIRALAAPIETEREVERWEQKDKS